jgi:DNA polymerase III gamma/tau subunit
MELYRKYRETTLDGILGNHNSKESLKAILARPVESRPHTFLFVGPAGCGKTTLAYIMAKEFGCKNIIEQNSADYRGIDAVRDFAAALQYMPLQGTQAYIFEEAHKFTQEASEALLKPTENCPEHTYLFFTTTDASKINAALKTRMIIIQVESISDAAIAILTKSVCDKEQITITDAVIEHIAKSASGSPRRALTMLEKVIGLPEEEQLKVAGYADLAETFAIDLCRLLIKKSEWMVIANVLSTLTVEPEAVRRAVLGYMRAVLLKKDSAPAVIVATHFERNYYDTGNVGLVLSCYRAWMDLKG